MPLNRADGLILGPIPISTANKLLDSLLGDRNISLQSTQPPCKGRLILGGGGQGFTENLLRRGYYPIRVELGKSEAPTG